MKRIEMKDKFGNISYNIAADDGRLLERGVSRFNLSSKEKYWAEAEKTGLALEAFLKELQDAGWTLPKPTAHTTKAGVSLQKSQVDFNTSDGWATMYLVYGSYMTHTYTERVGERFSGDGSSDGMRDAYKTVTVQQMEEYVFPSIQSMSVGRKSAYNEFQAMEMLGTFKIKPKA